MGLWDILSDPVKDTAIHASDQAANIDAINRYIAGTQPNTAKARKLQDDWLIWYGNLGWYSKGLDYDNEKIAYNMRNEFIRANADISEMDAVNAFLAKSPIINPVTGRPTGANATGDRPVEKPPLIPTMYKAIAVATAAGVSVLVVLKKIHIL